MKPVFMIHKSDTFLHSQETIIEQAGAKLAIHMLGIFKQIPITQEVVNIKMTAFGRKSTLTKLS